MLIGAEQVRNIMNRRDFLSTGFTAALGGAVASVGSASAKVLPWDSAEPFVFEKPHCPVIDARLRPRWGEFLKTFPAKKCGSAYGATGWTMPPSVAQESEELMLKEMDEAGVVCGMAMKRNIPNDSLVKMQEHFKGRVRSLCTLDASDPIDKNMAAIEQYAVNGPLKGVYLEPGRAKVTTQPNDPKLYPLYDLCSEKGLVVAIMTGGNNSPNLIRSTDHSCVADIAAAFPKVKFYMAHGGWPHVQEILGVAYWYKNVYLAGDMYMFGGAPGWREYVDAANGYLQDRFLFGSAYPLLPFKETIGRYKKFIPNKEIYEKVMYKNAAELFGIEI